MDLSQRYSYRTLPVDDGFLVEVWLGGQQVGSRFGKTHEEAAQGAGELVAEHVLGRLKGNTLVTS